MAKSKKRKKARRAQLQGGRTTPKKAQAQQAPTEAELIRQAQRQLDTAGTATETQRLVDRHRQEAAEREWQEWHDYKQDDYKQEGAEAPEPQPTSMLMNTALHTHHRKNRESTQAEPEAPREAPEAPARTSYRLPTRRIKPITDENTYRQVLSKLNRAQADLEAHTKNRNDLVLQAMERGAHTEDIARTLAVSTRTIYRWQRDAKRHRRQASKAN